MARHEHRRPSSPRLSPRRVAAALMLFASSLALAKDKPRKPVPANPADTYALHDTHNNVTVAAEPGDLPETRPNTRLDYFHHGFMPIRVIVTNRSTHPVSLDDARILFIAGDDYTRNAATDEELQRRMFSRKSVDGTHIPMPAPIPTITIHHPPVDKQILEDDFDFGFPTTTVAPHTTVSGYLFYDTRDMDDPVLPHATLELRRAHFADTKEELQAFEIPLKPSTAKPTAASSQ